MGHVIAIDVGGTHLRAAAYSPDSQTPLKHLRTKTHAPNETIFDRMTALIDAVWPGEVDAIGVSSPGPLDSRTGVVMATPNIQKFSFLQCYRILGLTSNFGRNQSRSIYQKLLNIIRPFMEWKRIC